MPLLLTPCGVRIPEKILKKSEKRFLPLDFNGFAWEVVGRSVSHWFEEIEGFLWDCLTALPSHFPFRMVDFAFLCIDRLGVLLQRLINAPNLSLRESLLRRVPTPPGWSTQVIPMSKAFEAMTHYLLIEGPADYTGSFPLSLTIGTFMERWLKIFTSKGRIAAILHRITPAIFRITFIKVLVIIWKILILLVAAMASWAGILMCASFVLSCWGSTPPLVPLGQSAKRLKVRTEGGGRIYRRIPGGSPP